MERSISRRSRALPLLICGLSCGLCTSVFWFWASLVDNDGFPRHERTIQTEDCLLCVFVGSHLDKAKSATHASHLVRDDCYYLDRAIRCERSFKVLRSCTCFHISDVKVLHCSSSL